MKSTRQGSLEHFLQRIVPLGLCTSFIIIKSSTQLFCALTVLFLRMTVAWPSCCFSEFCSFYLLNLSPLSLQTKATAVVFRSESITSEIHTLPSSSQHCACPAARSPCSRTASASGLSSSSGLSSWRPAACGPPCARALGCCSGSAPPGSTLQAKDLNCALCRGAQVC